jgi:hypothetical protein
MSTYVLNFIVLSAKFNENIIFLLPSKLYALEHKTTVDEYAEKIIPSALRLVCIVV